MNGFQKFNQFMKGKTYEEIYGIEKAQRFKEIRRQKFKGRVFTEETKRKMREARQRPDLIRISINNLPKNLKKEKHPNWRGGQTDETLQRLLNPEWNIIRKQVYKRDNWTCQKCKKRGGRLQCHHIIPWRYSRNDNIDNLITLCGSCHGQIEGLRQKEIGIE